MPFLVVGCFISHSSTSYIALTLLVRTILYALLLELPAFALCTVLATKGVRNPVLLGVAALIAPALPAYLAFWVWLASPKAGKWFDFLFLGIALFSCLYAIRKLKRDDWRPLSLVSIPIALSTFYAFLILCIGFLHGGTANPLITATSRFSHALPEDNFIPYVFAEALRNRRVPPPSFAGWLSSDRPPLQTGFALLQYAFMYPPREFGYEILSVILQSQWILALWILLRSLKIAPGAIALAVTVCMFSGFTFVNTFYVWPKLLAAAYILAFAALVLPNRHLEDSKYILPLAVTSGILAAMGMLSHGGSAFALLGLVAYLMIVKRPIRPKELGAFAIAVVVLYFPWILYQKFIDPPGDRLLKWHLAGIVAPDSRPFLQLLMNSYRNLTIPQFLANKGSNFGMIFGTAIAYWNEVLSFLHDLWKARALDSADIATAAANLKVAEFFYMRCALALFAFGPVALLAGVSRKRRSTEWKAAIFLWSYVAITVVIWCLMIFIPNSTAIHDGTYVTMLAAFAGSALAFWNLSRLLAIFVSAFHICMAVLIYWPERRLAITKYPLPEGDFSLALALFATLCVALICYLIMKMAVPESGVGANDFSRSKRRNSAIPLSRGPIERLHELHSSSVVR